jgi:TnsA endonuclease N terminal
MTTGRIHHLLSDLERDTFFLFDWRESVCDIREQFPLDREVTLRIADQLGVRHPRDPISDTPIIMTTDLLIDTMRGSRVAMLARAVKPEDELDKSRVLEKLEIERRYWTEQGIDWGIVTRQGDPGNRRCQYHVGSRLQRSEPARSALTRLLR